MAGAIVMTLPYPTASRPLVFAVYQMQDRRNARASMRVTLAFQGVDARTVRIVLAGDRALGQVMLLSNGLRDCRPSVGTLQEFAPQSLPAAEAPHAVDANGAPVGGVQAFVSNVETAISRQECALVHPAPRYDASTYGIDLLAGYRFLEDPHGTQFIPGNDRFAPVQDYLVRLDDAIEEVRFDGGTAIAARPNARELTYDASALVARWKDPHVASVREFSLFILAGAFALGISMLIELVKPSFLE